MTLYSHSLRLLSSLSHRSAKPEASGSTVSVQTRYLVIKELIDTEGAYMTQLGQLNSWFAQLEAKGHTNDVVKSMQSSLTQMIVDHQEWMTQVLAQFNAVDLGAHLRELAELSPLTLACLCRRRWFD